MFQIGSLIIFCGLLAQTTAYLANALPFLKLGTDQNPTGIPGGVSNALSPNQPISKLATFLNSDLAGNIVRTVKRLGELKDFQGLKVNVTSDQVLEVGFVPSTYGHRLYAKIPLAMDLEVKLPLLGSLVNVEVDLNITAEIEPVKDEQGRIHLAIGNCAIPPGELKITVLKGQSSISQSIVNNITDILTKNIPKVLHEKVCPLINAALAKLDSTLMNEIIELLTGRLNVVIGV